MLCHKKSRQGGDVPMVVMCDHCIFGREWAHSYSNASVSSCTIIFQIGHLCL